MMMEGLQTTFSIAFRDVVDAFMTAAFDDIKDLMLIQGHDADQRGIVNRTYRKVWAPAPRQPLARRRGRRSSASLG